MAELVDPNVALRESFLEAVREFRADSDTAVPWFVSDVDDDALVDEDAFAAYVARVLSEREASVDRPDWFVPMTTLWWADGDAVLGRIAVRHHLTPALETAGGHIGYDVRPTARRRGHATAMLAAVLPVARGLGIEQALLTCELTNTASLRVIETNGGIRLDTLGTKARFLVPTLRRPTA